MPIWIWKYSWWKKASSASLTNSSAKIFVSHWCLLKDLQRKLRLYSIKLAQKQKSVSWGGGRPLVTLKLSLSPAAAEHIAVTRQVTWFITLDLTLSNLTLVCCQKNLRHYLWATFIFIYFITFISVEEEELHKQAPAWSRYSCVISQPSSLSTACYCRPLSCPASCCRRPLFMQSPACTVQQAWAQATARGPYAARSAFYSGPPN